MEGFGGIGTLLLGATPPSYLAAVLAQVLSPVVRALGRTWVGACAVPLLALLPTTVAQDSAGLGVGGTPVVGRMAGGDH